jgi:hypothetical protein
VLQLTLSEKGRNHAHDSAIGAIEDDRRERGMVAVGSNVMNTTYDKAVTGLGPPASNSLEGA